jgi:hypothetical protein
VDALLLAIVGFSGKELKVAIFLFDAAEVVY